MAKKVLLLFTGGLDSTYLLQKNIKEGNEVTCLYTKLKNNGIKTDVEYFAALKIIEHYQHQASYTIKVIENEILMSGTPPLLPQIFLNLMISSFNTLGAMFDEVQIGYVSGDLGVSYIPDLINIFDTLNTSLGKVNKNKLTFPLVKEHKSEFINFLDEKVLKMIWSCERLYGGSSCIIPEKLDMKYHNICDCCMTNAVNLSRNSRFEYLLNKYYVQDDKWISKIGLIKDREEEAKNATEQMSKLSPEGGDIMVKVTKTFEVENQSKSGNFRKIN